MYVLGRKRRKNGFLGVIIAGNDSNEVLRNMSCSSVLMTNSLEQEWEGEGRREGGRREIYSIYHYASG